MARLTEGKLRLAASEITRNSTKDNNKMSATQTAVSDKDKDTKHDIWPFDFSDSHFQSITAEPTF